MKKAFNNNSNINLFDRFEKISGIDEDLRLYEEGTERFFKNIEGPKKDYQTLSKQKYKEFLVGLPRKISKEEKKIIAEEYDSLIQFKNRVEDKLDLTEALLKKSMEKRGVEYSLPIVKNKKLKRASKRFFGEKKTEITFEDYQKALQRKKELERYESNSLMDETED